MNSDYTSRSSIQSGKFLSIPGFVQNQQFPQLDGILNDDHVEVSMSRQMISFTDPKNYQKSELVESIDDGNLGSKQSFNMIIDNQQKSLGSSRLAQNSKFHFQLFQSESKQGIQQNQLSSEMDWLIQQGRKEISQKLRKDNQIFKVQEDSFSLPHQFSNDCMQENFFDLNVPHQHRLQKSSQTQIGSQKRQQYEREDFTKIKNPSLKNESKKFLSSRKYLNESPQLQEDQNENKLIVMESYRGGANQNLNNKGVKKSQKTRFLIATKFLASILRRKNLIKKQRKIENKDIQQQMHLCMIGDKASEFQNKLQPPNSFLSRNISLLQYNLANNFEIVRSLIVILVYIYSIFAFPVYDLMRSQKNNSHDWAMFTYNFYFFLKKVFIIFQGIDLGLNQLKRFKEPEKKDDIIYIILELFTIISVLLHLFLDIKILVYVILLRLLPIKKHWYNIEEKFQFKEISCVFRLIVLISILYHYMTCIRIKYLEDTQYMMAFHKVITGHINFKNHENISEIWFESGLGLLNLIVLFLIVGQAIKYHLGSQIHKIKQDKKIQLVVDSQENIGMSKQMLVRLKKHLQIELPKIELNNIKCERLLNSLDRQIKDEISYDIFSSIFKRSQILNEICTQECLLKLCTLIEYSKENELKISSQKLYILVKGCAQSTLLAPFSNIQLNAVEGTLLLNEYSFLSQEPLNLIIKVSSSSKIATLSYDDFIQTIRQNEVCFQKFYMFKEKIKVDRQNNLKNQQCDVYQQQINTLTFCSFAKYQIDRLALIKDYHKDFFHDRKKLYRSDKNRFNSRLNQNLIAILAMGFGIQKGYHKDQELTNDFQNLLKGNIPNYDDSLFNDNFEEKTSKTATIFDKQMTYNTHTRTDKVEITQKSQTSNININSDEQPSIHTTSMRVKPPEIRTQTASSIKVNFVKSNISELVPSTPSQQLKQFESRLTGNKKNSAASSVQQTQSLRPKISQSPYQIQSTISSVRHSNENQSFPYQSQINISTPSPTIKEVEIAQLQTPYDVMYRKGKRRFGFSLIDFDRAKVYDFFFPEFNLPLIISQFRNRIGTSGTSATPIGFIHRNEDKKETKETAQINNQINIQDYESKLNKKLRQSKTEIL